MAAVLRISCVKSTSVCFHANFSMGHLCCECKTGDGVNLKILHKCIICSLVPHSVPFQNTWVISDCYLFVVIYDCCSHSITSLKFLWPQKNNNYWGTCCQSLERTLFWFSHAGPCSTTWAHHTWTVNKLPVGLSVSNSCFDCNKSGEL